MSKDSRFRGPLDKQHGKRAQALLKPASQHLYHTHWSLATKLSSKKSLLLICQILGPLVNILAADERYPVLNRDNLTITIQMILSEKIFSQFFAAFPKSTLSFEHFQKKMTLIPFVIPKLRTLKTWIGKCLKSPSSENPSTSNMVNVPKHCWNLHHSTLIIFIGHWQWNCVWNSISYWHAKSYDCLLKHCLPMKSNVFFTGTI